MSVLCNKASVADPDTRLTGGGGVGRGYRNMKSVQSPLVTILLMTYFYRDEVDGMDAPWIPPGCATGHFQHIFLISSQKTHPLISSHPRSFGLPTWSVTSHWSLPWYPHPPPTFRLREFTAHPVLVLVVQGQCYGVSALTSRSNIHPFSRSCRVNLVK